MLTDNCTQIYEIRGSLVPRFHLNLTTAMRSSFWKIEVLKYYGRSRSELREVVKLQILL